MSFVGSIALIRSTRDDQDVWLARWNEITESYELPATQKDDELGYRDSLVEHLIREFSLDRKRDFIVSSVPRLHFQSPMELPNQCEPVWVVAQFFLVELFGKTSRTQLDADESNRWITKEEILGKDEGDLPFDAALRAVIRSAGIFE